MSTLIPGGQKLYDAIEKIVDTERVTIEIETRIEERESLTVATLRHYLTQKMIYVAVLAEHLETYTEQSLSGIAEEAIYGKAKYFLNDEMLASAVRWSEIREALTTPGGQR